MSVSGDTIVKVDFSKLDEYERTLTRISQGVTQCTDETYDQEKKLDAQIEYPSSGYGSPSGPLEERDEVRMYRVELEEIGFMISNMLYAIKQYKTYYEEYGAYPSGQLVFDADAVETILDDFKELIWEEGWQDDITTDDFSFNIWEHSIMAGIGIQNAREKAVEYNRGVNDQLREELSAMITILKNKADTLVDNSSVYVTDLKPLVDGVTVNEILTHFNIDDIDYKRLEANTDVLDYVESSIGASEILRDNFSDQNGEVTFESVMKKLKNGITLTNGEVSLLQKKFSKIVNSYDITVVDYFYYKQTIDGYFIKLTDEGYTQLRIHIERTLEELHIYSIKGVYKETDPEYIDLKKSGKLADTSRYLSYGGYIIDVTLLSKSIAEGNLSDAFSQGTKLTISLIGEYIAISTEFGGEYGLLISIGAVVIGSLCAIPMEYWGNQIESDVDWFGDGID